MTSFPRAISGFVWQGRKKIGKPGPDGRSGKAADQQATTVAITSLLQRFLVLARIIDKNAGSHEYLAPLAAAL